MTSDLTYTPEMGVAVWDSLALPGGFVCAHPVRKDAPGIDHPIYGRVCGMPVESEPCPTHNPVPASLNQEGNQP